MKSISKLVLALIIGVLFLGAVARAQRPSRRINFARGATVARVTGYLRGVRDEAWFVLRVGAGQHVRVEIKGRGPTRGVLYFPSGKQDGGPGGVIFEGTVDESGDYRIRVTESSMAEAWRGSFVLTIRIAPLKASNGLRCVSEVRRIRIGGVKAPGLGRRRQAQSLSSVSYVLAQNAIR